MVLVQSVVFNRPIEISTARKWLKIHGFRHDYKVDVTPNTLRFRQHDPAELERKHYRFRTKQFPLGYFVLAYTD